MVQVREFTDGFESYPAGITTVGYGLASTWNGPTTNNLLVAGRFGGQGVRGSGVDTVARRPVTPTSQLVVGHALFTRATLVQRNITIFETAAGVEQIRLRHTLTGAVEVVRGSTVLATTAFGVVTASAWHYFEFAATISTTTGSIRVYLNDFELTDLALDNVNTQAVVGTGTVGIVGIMIPELPGIIDDTYCEVNGMTRVGEGRILLLPVNSDVTTDFSRSTGTTNYENVNQVPIDKTRYNSSGVVGAIDMFTVTDLAFSPEKIYGLQVISLSEKDESGARAHKNRLLSGATLVEGTDFVETLRTSIIKRDFWSIDPNTGLPWSVSAVNGVQIGYRVSI